MFPSAVGVIIGGKVCLTNAKAVGNAKYLELSVAKWLSPAGRRGGAKWPFIRQVEE